jgi:hypothetical protein
VYAARRVVGRCEARRVSKGKEGDLSRVEGVRGGSGVETALTCLRPGAKNGRIGIRSVRRVVVSLAGPAAEGQHVSRAKEAAAEIETAGGR